MTDEAQTFQDSERAKTEQFQMSLAAMGYNFEDSQRQNEDRLQKQGALEGLGAAAIGGAGKAAAAYFTGGASMAAG